MRRSAALLIAAAAGVVGLAPALPAWAAAKPTHVAIVIAGKGVACVPWHSGITGDEVLNDVATVRYRPTDGLITQIDGTPANNRADETHYWSYWHRNRADTAWIYSNVGASAFLPRAGAVEGWKFVNGSDTASPPPNRTYASICHDTAAATPPAVPTSSTRSSTAPPAPSATPSCPPGTPQNAACRADNSGTGDAPATASAAASSSPRSTARPAARPRSAAPAAGAGPTSPPTTLPSLRVRTAGESQQATDQGSMLPTVLVGGVVLALGAGAAVAARRRRHAR